MTRNPVVVFVLCIVTVGAFGVYWHYRTNEELRSRGEEVRPALSALAVSWGALLILPALVSCALTAARVRDRSRAVGLEGPSVAAAIALLPVALYAPYIQRHLNRLDAAPSA